MKARHLREVQQQRRIAAAIRMCNRPRPRRLCHRARHHRPLGRFAGQLPVSAPLPVIPAPKGYCDAYLAATQVHWLDRRFPGVRLWLEDKNREWWISGLVQARCK